MKYQQEGLLLALTNKKMWNIKDEINNGITKTKAKAEMISIDYSKEILLMICEKYVKGKKYQFQLWDYLLDSKSYYDSNGWEIISELIKKEEAILFFEWVDEKNMFFFQDGFEIKKVLAECYGMTIYVTDINFEYLLCYNDHDRIIGCGKIKGKLENHYL